MERDSYPEQIFVAERAAEKELGSQIIDQYPPAKVTRVKSVLDIRPPKSGLKGRIEWGRRVLVISRSRKFAEQFHNDAPSLRTSQDYLCDRTAA